MPRKAREKSASGIYHVMLRAINRQQIFYEEEDYQYFLNLLSRYKNKCQFKLYAYCLMGNHVHLLIGADKEPLDQIMRHIGTAFVYWYNNKYARNGHLFQDRYRSEAVETDSYLLVVLRYILRNSVKAGLCSSPEEYRYSSGREYIKSKKGITDTFLAFNLMSIEELRSFLFQETDEKCLEIDESIRRRCSDSTAMRLIMQEFGTLHPVIGEQEERGRIYASICRLIESGISIRQLSRLTGITKAMIERAIREGKTSK